MSSDKEMLWEFGKVFMKTARDLSITQEFKVVEGEAKAPSSIKLHERIGVLKPQQSEAIKDVIVDAVDHALNNFLWVIEQHEEFDLVCYKDGRAISLRDLSDGLCGDYWNFVDMFSKFKPS